MLLLGPIASFIGVTLMTVVVGLGNPLRADEGVGVRIVHELMKNLGDEHPDVRLLDIGTSGLHLLDAFAGADAAIIIDCALMGRQPGTMLRFTQEEVESRREGDSITPHSGALLRLADLAKSLGECPEDIVFFGAEPLSLGYVAAMSPLLEERLPLYCERIVQEIERSGA